MSELIFTGRFSPLARYFSDDITMENIHKMDEETFVKNIDHQVQLLGRIFYRLTISNKYIQQEKENKCESCGKTKMVIDGSKCDFIGFCEYTYCGFVTCMCGKFVFVDCVMACLQGEYEPITCKLCDSTEQGIKMKIKYNCES